MDTQSFIHDQASELNHRTGTLELAIPTSSSPHMAKGPSIVSMGQISDLRQSPNHPSGAFPNPYGSNSTLASETTVTEPSNVFFGAERAESGLGPNLVDKISDIRHRMREYLAEFAGTLVFLIFAFGGDCIGTISIDTGMSSNPRSDPTGVALAWGAGLGLGVWISGSISGGHLNPAVTIAMAVCRGFKWKKVPGYIAAQTAGAICATLIVYGNYYDAITRFDPSKTPKSASMFATYPSTFVSPLQACFSEVIGTALLVGIIFAVTDKNQVNGPPGKGVVAGVLALTMTGIALAWGWITSFAINPARDFGPRIALAMVGYGGAVFTNFHCYFIWGPIISTIVGGLLGAGLYDLFIYEGEERMLSGRFSRRRSSAGSEETLPVKC